ncbi:unnamed protein product [[Candida] boidinii]|uniref:Unnamed protein product n=1 Tax=Candida boidinii TaxID=5477 RepID=A0A9W6WF47_CANBO|nr:transferase activity, transferring glycosyl groups protein [[Candida] boidinii]GME68910.1 unnamed protein product [[Candida] boidinii]GMF51502.1 unnamed protein product [[Candida] boidinii]GMG18723.1 unnamed protein product [[Candida] boidinii]
MQLIMSRKFYRVSIFLVILITILIVTDVINLSAIARGSSLSPIQNNKDNLKDQQESKDYYELDPNKSKIIDDIFKLLVKTKPTCDKLNYFFKDKKAVQNFWDDKGFYHSEDYLRNKLVKFTKGQLTELKKKHKLFVDSIKKEKFQAFGIYDKENISGSGITMVGGGKFSWLALINIHQLRTIGCKLPIEVFIGTYSDYDQNFCDRILPGLNAKCTLGFKKLPMKKYEKVLSVKGFQYKILAILLSSFENVLLVDVDNYARYDPSHLFSSNIYTENKLILWPDCWSRTTNPNFYKIANIEVDMSRPIRGSYSEEKLAHGDLLRDFNFHDFKGTLPNPTSESGMVMVNKIEHAETLLLILYYNIYGPDFYYPMITQGGAGEGDKDTFIAAAYALNKKVYQVKQGMSFIGYHEDGFHSKALGQWDPTTPRELNADNPGEVLFMHCSYPKLYPTQLEGELIKSKKDENEDENEVQHRRMYIGENANSRYDFELELFEIMTQLICKDYPEINKEENEKEASVEADKLRDNQHEARDSGATPESDELKRIKRSQNVGKVSIKDPLSGLEMKYIQNYGFEIEDQCKKVLLPHVNFLIANTAYH